MKLDSTPAWLRLLQRARVAITKGLFDYYRLCGRTGFDLPNPGSRLLILKVDEVVCLRRDSGASHLEVRKGTVWLTSSPARGDILLGGGDRFPLKDNWPFVVQALRSAKIVLR